MPETTPISRTEAALAASTAGALIVAQGPAGVPTTPASLTYTDGAAGSRVLALAGGRLDLDVSALVGGQFNVFSLTGDGVNPPFRLGGSSQTDVGGGRNFVVPLGHNVNGQAGLVDPAKPSSAIVFEGDYHNPAMGEQTFETYIQCIFPDATVRRPWFANIGKTSKTVVAGWRCSDFTIGREDDANLLSVLWNPTTLATQFTTVYPGTNSGTTFAVGGTATSDSLSLGRATNAATNVFTNVGASGQIDWKWQLNNVEKFKESLNGTSGGEFSLYGPGGNQVDVAWVAGGVDYRQIAAKLKVGYVVPAQANAQLNVQSLLTSTIAFMTQGASGQTADIVQTLTGAGVKCFATDAAGKTAIGSGGTPIAAILSVTATLDFGSVAAQTSADLAVSITGAAVGDLVIITSPGTVDANACYTGRVSATDTISVRFNNYSAAAIDPASGTYRVAAFKF
jgi:hypothetical protein